MSGDEEVKPVDDKKKAKMEQLAKARAVGKEKRLAKEKRLSELEQKLSRLDNNLEKPEEKHEEKPEIMSDTCDESETSPQVVTRAFKKLKTEETPGFFSELLKNSLMAVVPLALTGAATYLFNQKKTELRVQPQQTTQSKPVPLKEHTTHQDSQTFAPRSLQPVGKSGWYF